MRAHPLLRRTVKGTVGGETSKRHAWVNFEANSAPRMSAAKVETGRCFKSMGADLDLQPHIPTSKEPSTDQKKVCNR